VRTGETSETAPLAGISLSFGENLAEFLFGCIIWGFQKDMLPSIEDDTPTALRRHERATIGATLICRTTFMYEVTMKIPESARRLLTVPNAAAFLFLALTLATAGRYGFFGDELYYIVCGKHPAWGYVDHPPMVAFLTFLGTHLFGENIFALRLMSGLAGAATVLLSSRIAEALGGGTFSKSLSALSILFAAAFPALSSFFSMNSVDIMLCTLLFLLFLRVVQAPSPKRWIGLGAVYGAGLLNKYTFLVLGFSLLLSLVITKRWNVLKSPWLYIAGGLSCFMFLPHILWQISNGWPTLEFMHNATEYKNLSLSPLSFFIQLIVGLNPLTLPLWVLGLGWLLLTEQARPFRYLGWTACFFLLIYMAQNSKFYYVVPLFPLLLAAGSVAFERFSQRLNARWPRRVVVLALVVSGTILMPLAAPILSVRSFVEYSKTLGLWDMIRMEKGEGDVLPLHFVLRFGWEELVDSVAGAYNALPPEERDSCAILASWYGPAGAVDHFGPALGLPHAISPRNNYWIWGPRGYSGEVVLAVGFSEEFLRKYFEDVRFVTYAEQEYAYRTNVYLCRNPRIPFDVLWQRIKNFV